MKYLWLAVVCLCDFAYGQRPLVSGPWANAGLTTATIWAEVSPSVRKVQVAFYKTGSEKDKKIKDYAGSLGREFNPVKIDLVSLELNTQYHYYLILDGTKVNTAFPTKFTTNELWRFRKPAPDFTFLTGSCAYFNEPQFDRPGKPYGGDSSIFEAMAKESAAFMLWLGDNWYTREVDYTTAWGLKRRASRDRSMPVLQPFLASMSQYAIWDDHDFGPNDADGSYLLKDSSRRVFIDYSCNPAYGENGEGIYSKFSFSDVDFFLMDDRFFRSNERMKDSIAGMPDPSKHFFGSRQAAWLKNALLYSNATFKIIACGSQVLNPVSSFECMRSYSFEFFDLMNFLEKQQINGVLFLTGDRHHSEIIKITRPQLFPLYDITVSPLTAGVAKATGAEATNAFREPGTLVEEQNYGRFTISGDKGNRKLRVEFLDRNGMKVAEWQVDENQLKANP